jgi:hypothetical protein
MNRAFFALCRAQLAEAADLAESPASDQASRFTRVLKEQKKTGAGELPVSYVAKL